MKTHSLSVEIYLLYQIICDYNFYMSVVIKLNIFTQSVGYAVKAYKQGITGEKGMGCESPASTVGVCIECFYIRRRKPVIGKLRRRDIKMRILIYMV